MNEFINDDDLLDDEDIEIEETTRRRSKDSTKRGTKPIENAEMLPLFPTAALKQVNVASYLKVTKQDKPNNGYKGRLPASSTEETILMAYGPGTYTVEACNDQNHVLITIDNLTISGEYIPPSQSDKKTGETSESALLAIKMANNQAEQASKRQEETHRETMKLMTDTNKNSQDVLQSFFKETQSSQVNFFTAMQALNNESKIQMGQMFQQTMLLLTTGHQQTMEFLRASNDRERDQNNPMVMVQMLMQGLKLGKEMGEDSDQDPLIAALKEGGGMLSSIAQIKSGSPVNVPALPNPTQPIQSKPTNSQTGTLPKSKAKSAFSKDEITAVVKLKKLLAKKGLDLKTVLSQVEIVYEDPPPDDNIPGDGESDEIIPDENGPGNTDSNDSIWDSEKQESESL
jgi:hypothetical protein